MYASARQNVDQYKPRIDAAIDNLGDSSFINIDFSISSPAPKFIDIVVNNILNQEYKIEFNSIDPLSHTRREKQRDEYFGKLIRKELIGK